MAEQHVRQPVLRRLERLRSQWRAFAEDPEARLLRWVLARDDWSMVEAFFRVEDEASGPECDLFLRLTAPFEDPRHHGSVLLKEFEHQYAAIRPALDEAGADTSWQAPPAARADDVYALLEAAASFHEHHQPLFRHLVLVLLPESISCTRQWAQWVERAVRSASHPNVRWVCFDYQEPSVLGPLARAQGRRVRTQVAGLDMGAAVEEVSEAAGRLETPQGCFRHLFVQMGRALESSDLERARQLASKAVAIARQEGWAHLQVVTHIALGSGYLSAGEALAALREYHRAELAAEQSQARGEPQGTRLRLQARLSMGAALVATAAHEQAAALYEQTAPLAEQLEDRRMELECWRMAAWSHEQCKAWEPSWSCGMRALGVAQRMDEETRRTSTLGYVGEGLLRLTRTWKYWGRGPAIEEQLERLLGQEWRPAVQRMSSGASP